MRTNLILALIWIFCNCTSFKIPTNNESLEGNDKTIKIFFSNNQNFDDLVLIRQKLKKSHIMLTYKKLLFNKESKLKAISITVTCDDGFEGSASTENIELHKSFGIYRNFSDTASIKFMVGNLN
jgi:hypothetical protein